MTPEYVEGLLVGDGLPTPRLVRHVDQGLDHHQDLYTVQRVA